MVALDDAQSRSAPGREVSTRRPEIQGLRALAVLAVVLFHANVPGFGGGFVGVDIFFVISGYLITRNIVHDIDSHQFTFRAFYARRVRRIVPAMVTTVLLTLVVGFLWLPPKALWELSSEALASFGFVSNIYFWLSSHQYFTPDSDDLYLLHLWSLSVEEQFYLAWPLIIFWASRVGRTHLVVSVLLLLGVLASQYFLKQDSSAVFYLTPFRVYQFALGASVFMLEHKSPRLPFRQLALILGLVLCVGTVVALDSSTRLAPIAGAIGAALIIYGGNTGRAAGLLTNPAAIMVGEVSYSVYLAHWPILVLFVYLFGSPIAPMTQLAAIAAALAIGWAMYRWVERPFRASGGFPPAGHFLRVIAAGVVVSAVLAAAVYFGAGWIWRLTAGQQEYDRLVQAGAGPCEIRRNACNFGDLTSSKRILIVGDSYAEHYIAGLDGLAKAQHFRGTALISGGCLVLSGILRVGWEDARCRSDRDRILGELGKTDDPIVISQAWMGYPNGSIGDDTGKPIDISSESQRLGILVTAVDRTIHMLDNGRRRFVIVGAQVLATCDIDINRLGAAPLGHTRVGPCPPTTRASIEAQNAPIDGMLAGVAAKYGGRVLVLRPTDAMCTDLCTFGQGAVSYYRDRGHLSVAGSEHFVHAIADRLTAFLDGVL